MSTNSFTSEFESFTGLTFLEPYQGSKKHHRLQCTICKTEFSATPHSQTMNVKRRIKQGSAKVKGCRECNKRDKMDPAKHTQELAELKVTLLEDYKGAVKLHKVQCNTCNHIWQARPSIIKQCNKVYNTNGCPNCEKINKTKPKQKTTIKSSPSKPPSKRAQNRVEYVNRLLSIDVKIIGEFTKAKTHHDLLCMKCNHIWNATPVSCLQSNKKYGTNGCPNCNKQKKTDQYALMYQHYEERIREKGFMVEQSCTGYKNEMLVTNIECNHKFTTTPERILGADVKCPVCNVEAKKQRLNHNSKVRSEEFHKTSSDWEKYKSKVKMLTELNYKQNKNVINPNGYPRGIAGTSGAYHLDHKVPVRLCFEEGILPEDCAAVENLQMLPWAENVSKKVNFQLDVDLPDRILTQFKNSVGNKSIQVEIAEYCKEHNIAFETQSDIISPYKLDFYIPSIRLGIKFHDVMQIQQSKITSSKYLENIKKYCDKQNVDSVQFFDDEVVDNRSIILSKIKYKLEPRSAKMIHARQCNIKEVDSLTRNKFLERNHIQGPDKATTSLGAYHNDQLVAVMTFCKPRVIMSGDLSRENTWELSRFATDITTRIPGVASKLLTHFKRNYQWDEIYSYADKRWSQGNVYQKLGFEEAHHNPPAYWYVIDGKRKHRWGYRKDALKKMFDNYDPTQTEYQNMLKNGYDRVWDCGTIKYVMKRDNVG